jgi:NAD-dependent SIR2 family protein deacetylase
VRDFVRTPPEFPPGTREKGGENMGEVRCIICGRVIEEPAIRPDDEDEPVRKPMTVCPRCQAKLKHEADEKQKVPKPM